MKVFRRLRMSMLQEGKLKKYLLYAVGEILLIVVGILLALQLNAVKERRIRRSNELTIYQAVKDQLINYKSIIEDDIQFNNTYALQFEFGNQLIENQDREKVDTLAKIAGNLVNYSDFDGVGNIYQNLVNSGEIKLLSNPQIIEGIRQLEERFLRINRIENIHYEAMMTYVIPGISSNVKISTGEPVNPEKLYSTEFQNLILMILKLIYEKDEVYRRTNGEIDQMIGLIDQEIAK